MSELWNARQTAEAFSVTVKTIHEWVKDKHLVPTARIGLRGDLRFSTAELQRFATENGATLNLPDSTQK